jgi:hypothetical protein
MKEPKNAANFASRIKLKGRLACQRGLSLVELLISAGIGSIVAVAIAFVMFYVAQQFQILVAENQVQQDVMQAAYYTRYFLSQAIELRGSNTAVAGSPFKATPMAPPPGVTASTGYIGGQPTDIDGPCTNCPGYRSGTFVQNGSVDLVAYFNADLGGAGRDTNGAMMGGSKFVPGAIFFRRPDANSTAGLDASGAIVFNREEFGAGNTIAKTASFNDLVFPGIVRFEIDVVPLEYTPNATDPLSGPQGPAKTCSVTIVGRYFKTTDRLLWNFHPLANQPSGPVVTAPYKDFPITFSMGFRNNALRPSQIAGPGVVERLHGNLYYYRMSAPSLSNPIAIN